MPSAEILLSSSNGGRVPVGRRYSVVWGETGVTGQEAPRLLLLLLLLRGGMAVDMPIFVVGEGCCLLCFYFM